MNPNVEYDNQPNNDQPSRRSSLMPLIAGVITIVLILVIAGVVIHDRNHSNGNTSKKSGSESSKSSNTSATNTTNSGSPKAQAPTSTASTSTSSSNSSNSTQQLNNTGPGNTVGLFVGVSILGAAVHYVYTRKRPVLNKHR